MPEIALHRDTQTELAQLSRHRVAGLAALAGHRGDECIEMTRAHWALNPCRFRGMGDADTLRGRKEVARVVTVAFRRGHGDGAVL
jgi:hypothetical protein